MKNITKNQLMILKAESPDDIEILNNFKNLINVKSIDCIIESQYHNVIQILVRFEKVKSKMGPHAYFEE